MIRQWLDYMRMPVNNPVDKVLLVLYGVAIVLVAASVIELWRQI